MPPKLQCWPCVYFNKLITDEVLAMRVSHSWALKDRTEIPLPIYRKTSKVLVLMSEYQIYEPMYGGSVECS